MVLFVHVKCLFTGDRSWRLLLFGQILMGRWLIAETLSRLVTGLAGVVGRYQRVHYTSVFGVSVL